MKCSWTFDICSVSKLRRS